MVLGGLKTLFLCLPLCLTFNDVLGLVCDREEDNTSGSETERERERCESLNQNSLWAVSFKSVCFFIFAACDRHN